MADPTRGSRFYRELALAGGLFAASMLLFASLAARGWQGAPNPCVLAGDCYCEAPRAGGIAQPANTWSCLAGVAVGLLIAWHAGRARAGDPGSGGGLMRASRFYPALYALVVTYSGVAAMFFHASLTDWGGKLDMSSMYLFVGFWIFYNLARVYELSRGVFVALYATVTLVLLVPRLFFDASGLPIFVVLIGGAVLSEILVSLPRSVRWLGPRRAFSVRRAWFLAALAVYGPAFAVWWLSRAGGPLCEPASLLQGHAVWHVLTALSPGALYLYFLDES